MFQTFEHKVFEIVAGQEECPFETSSTRWIVGLVRDASKMIARALFEVSMKRAQLSTEIIKRFSSHCAKRHKLSAQRGSRFDTADLRKLGTSIAEGMFAVLDGPASSGTSSLTMQCMSCRKDFPVSGRAVCQPCLFELFACLWSDLFCFLGFSAATVLYDPDDPDYDVMIEEGLRRLNKSNARDREALRRIFSRMETFTAATPTADKEEARTSLTHELLGLLWLVDDDGDIGRWWWIVSHMLQDKTFDEKISYRLPRKRLTIEPPVPMKTRTGEIWARMAVVLCDFCCGDHDEVESDAEEKKRQEENPSGVSKKNRKRRLDSDDADEPPAKAQRVHSSIRRGRKRNAMDDPDELENEPPRKRRKVASVEEEKGMDVDDNDVEMVPVENIMDVDDNDGFRKRPLPSDAEDPPAKRRKTMTTEERISATADQLAQLIEKWRPKHQSLCCRCHVTSLPLCR